MASFPSRRNSRNLLLLSSPLPPPPSSSSLGFTGPVPLRSPRNRPALRPNSAPQQQQQQTPDGPPRYYLLGTRLESRISTWNRMYPGRVAAVNLDGTLQVAYDDGDLRDCVTLANVCFETRQDALPLVCQLVPGSQVEYSLEAATWIPAKVVEAASGDVYNLSLCNGRLASNVSRAQIRCYLPPTLRPQDQVEVLFPDTKSWATARVDDTGLRLLVDDTSLALDVHDVEVRYPIPYVAPAPQQDEDEFLDATPMLLSMQERISQSIEVGAQVLITDKNGGALPKTGKADSAQVSIINFPLPADGLVETITFRLFEPPAEESNQLEVILFDREPVRTSAAGGGGDGRLQRSESAEEPSPQHGPVLAPGAPPPPPKVYVSPDLPYRVSHSYIQIDPHSRLVQCCKLAVPLRGSAGQYLGVMNRKGRLNIAYTPDKKKPGESWSEKSVEVFYLMPRMVPKSFVGGPYSTREWHGRAGWFATLLVSDPVDAVDPAFQRRCELYALSKAGGSAQLAKLCWLLTSLLKTRGTEFADQLLYKTPVLLKALRVLCQVSDPVVDLVSKLCAAASALAEPPRSLLKLQSALRFKAAEMHIVQQGRHRIGEAATSFQSLLRCLLAVKRLTAVFPTSSSQLVQPSSSSNTVRILLPPQPATEMVPLIRYELRLTGKLVAASSSTALLSLPNSGKLQLVVAAGAEEREDADEVEFRTLLRASGPIQSVTGELYFPPRLAKSKRLWELWTSPVELEFKLEQSEEATSTVNTNNGDWLEDLERCTLLLRAFSQRKRTGGAVQAPSPFVREQYVKWRKHQDRQVVSLDASTGKAEVCVPNASRLRLEWIRPPHLVSNGLGGGSTLVITNQAGMSLAGRNGLPPPLQVVEGSGFTVTVLPHRADFDPEFLLHQSLEAEKADFGLALGLSNCLGEPAKIRSAGGELQVSCTKCGAGGCKEEPVCNVEDRPVTLHRSRFSCSSCEASPVPCVACSLFPDSLAARKSIRVRPKSSFEGLGKYEAFMKRVLVPGVPVRVAGWQEVLKFQRFDPNTHMCWLRGRNNVAYPLADLELVESPLTEPAEPAAFSPGRDRTAASSSTSATNSSGRPGTFAVADLGPDIELSDHALTCTRLRSVGWGTQRLAAYLDSGITVVVFKIVRNSSNHLFFGVVGTAFAEEGWSKRLTEPGAWAIRRDGTLHANGREFRAADPPAEAHLGNGEELTMTIDMTEDRSVTFSRSGNQVVLGRLAGLPARVVPVVSFGGSSQFVSIVSYLHTSPSPNRPSPVLSTTATTAAVIAPVTAAAAVPITSPSTAGQTMMEGMGTLEILPEFDEVDPKQELEYLSAANAGWTAKQDRLLVCHVDQVSNEQRLGFVQLMLLPEPCAVLFDPQRAVGNRFLQLLLEEHTIQSVWQRFEWLAAFNRSVSRALPLLDLSFADDDDEDGDGDGNQDGEGGSARRDLGECAYLLFDSLKRPMWEEALESTRTEEGQFEVVLDFGKALAHRDFVDVHGRFTVFAQAFRAMNSMPPSRLRGKGQLYRATLRGMRAHDDGGPYRQSMATYCEELMSTPGTGLFLPCANRTNEIAVNRDRWLPNPGCCSAMQLQMFEFVGKLMGIALRNREFLNLRLPTLVWKWLVNRRPTFEDLRAVDLLFANRVGELLGDAPAAATIPDLECEVEYVHHQHQEEQAHLAEDGTDESMMMNFTCYSLDGRVIELVPNGTDRVLENTRQDRKEWATLAIKYKLNEFNPQLEAIRRGLHSVVPQRMLMLFQVDELELMVCGRPIIDLALLREMTVYAGCTVHDAHIAHFWNVLASFTHELRSLYLKFVFGRSTLPSKEAWGAPHKISSFETRNPLDVDSLLPRSHTCYFSLDLPRYSSEEVLRRKLLFAIENCTEIDADQTTTGNRSAALGFDLNLDLEELVEQQQQGQHQPAVHRSVSPSVALVNSFGSFSSRTSERNPFSSSSVAESEGEEDEGVDEYWEDQAVSLIEQEFQLPNLDNPSHNHSIIDFDLQ
ncbi:hypothetical protein BASA81_002484 [Batrachochytrium salamandrivorans]|nr:hypothetical protein BASA81_002484 [Batrachochytrium salamandrivorans]